MKKCNYLSLGSTYINMDKVESIDINKAGLIINVLFGHTAKEVQFKDVESFNYNVEKIRTFLGMGVKD